MPRQSDGPMETALDYSKLEGKKRPDGDPVSKEAGSTPLNAGDGGSAFDPRWKDTGKPFDSSVLETKEK